MESEISPHLESDVEIPIFPLPLVLLPGEPLTLRIFEPRYKQMIDDCLMNDHPFGVCLENPRERICGWSAPRRTGCTAVIEEFDDISTNLIVHVIGGTRFEISSTIDPFIEAFELLGMDVFPSVEELMEGSSKEGEDRLYIRGNISWISDPEDEWPMSRWSNLVIRWRDWVADFARRLDLDVNEHALAEAIRTPDAADGIQALWEIAISSRLDVLDRQSLITCRSFTQMFDLMEKSFLREPLPFEGMDFRLSEE